MPRIAAAILVFVLISFSIGLNISRYPMVWEMVGAAGNLPQTEETDEPYAATQTAETETDADSEIDYERPYADEQVEDIAADNGYRPVGSRRFSDADEQSEPDYSYDDYSTPSSDEDTADVQRLPPVGPSDPADAHLSRGSDGPIPFYPNTGI